MSVRFIFGLVPPLRRRGQGTRIVVDQDFTEADETEAQVTTLLVFVEAHQPETAAAFQGIDFASDMPGAVSERAAVKTAIAIPFTEATPQARNVESEPAKVQSTGVEFVRSIFFKRIAIEFVYGADLGIEQFVPVSASAELFVADAHGWG